MRTLKRPPTAVPRPASVSATLPNLALTTLPSWLDPSPRLSLPQPECLPDLVDARLCALDLTPGEAADANLPVVSALVAFVLKLRLLLPVATAGGLWRLSGCADSDETA